MAMALQLHRLYGLLPNRLRPSAHRRHADCRFRYALLQRVTHYMHVLTQISRETTPVNALAHASNMQKLPVMRRIKAII